MNKKHTEMNHTFLVKIRNFISNNLRLIIYTIIMSVVSCAMVAVKFIIGQEIHLDSKKAIFAFLIVLSLTFIVFLILYFAKKKKWKIEKIYLIIGLLLGMVFCVLTPVTAPPDEAVHFWGAYEYADGQTDFQGELYAPANLDEIIADNPKNVKYKNQFENFGVMASQEYESAPRESLNTPLGYIPQILGILVGKIFNLPLIPIFIIARIFNMIICVVIIYFCLKYIPILKKPLFMMALFPMTVQLFSSVSYDGIIICAAVALITYVLYARDTMKRKFRIWDFLLLVLVCLVLTTIKPVYALLCPLVFWIPKERFKNNKYKIGIIIALGVVVSLFLLVRMFSHPIEDGGRYGVSDLQMNILLYSPITFMVLLARTSITYFGFYVNSMFGEFLNALNVDIFWPYIMVLIIMFALLCSEAKGKIPISMKLYNFIAFFGVFVLTEISMFIAWTMKGSLTIEGVQGRYFLSVLLLIPMFCLSWSRKNKKGDQERRELVRPETLYLVTTLVDVLSISLIYCSHL